VEEYKPKVTDKTMDTLIFWIANVLTGGDVDAGTLVSEAYVMTLERQAFCALIVHPKTQERILAMLNTGKPLRN
jgi:3-hydroxyacyl-CoA dehydrogenase